MLLVYQYILGITLLGIISSYYGKIKIFAVFAGILILGIIIAFTASTPWKTYPTKTEINKYIPVKHRLEIHSTDDLKMLNYPIIFKPDKKSNHGRGVALINTLKEAEEYMKHNKIDDTIIAQEFEPGPYEVGVLYERFPFSDTGAIFSIVEKKRKYPSADKWLPMNYVEDLVDQIQLIDHPEWITPEVNQSIENITKSVPMCYACRFDIRFNNISDFLKGKNFKVVEINLAHGSDYKGDVRRCKIEMIPFRIWITIRWFIIRLLIGLHNLLTGKAHPWNCIKTACYMLYYEISTPL